MELRAGYKQTEVGVIPEDWEVAQLSEMIESLDAGVSVNSVDKEKDIFAHEESVLKTSCVFGGTFFPEEHKKIIPRDIQRAKLSPRSDTIIFSRMNTPALVGECGYVSRDYPNLFLPDRLWMTRRGSKKSACVRWLSHLLSYNPFNRTIKDSATGTSGSMKNISKDSLLSVQVPYPTKAEQEAIAEALSDADALIESLEQIIAKKLHLKQGAMQELLTGKRRLHGFANATIGYKQTDVGVMPEDWEVARLADVCFMKSGEGITSANIDHFSQYPCYGGNGLRGFTTRFTHDGRYALIGRQGALCGNVLGVDGKFFASEHAIVVTASARTDIHWLTLTLGEMQLNQYSESSAQPGLSVSKLLRLDVARPPTKAEQEAIAVVLSDMDTEIAALKAKLDKARQLKQGMMHNLLTGRTRLI